MSKTYYTSEHEWIRVEGDIATVGITDYAQDHLGDVVVVQLPDNGTTLAKGGAAATLDSVKTASEVYAPADGVVVAVNDALTSDPGLINSAPDGAGWLWKMSLTDAGQLDELMDEAGYKALIA